MLKNKHGLRLLVLTLFATLLSGIIGPNHLQAADSLQSVAESYQTSKPLQHGMIVQLADNNKRSISPSTYSGANKMLGVTVAPSDTPVSISSEDDTQAYVVTGGRYRVLVTNQNGPIRAGDFVSVSSVNGVGMRADDKTDTVLGRAVSGFNGTANVISTTSLKTSDGKQMQAAIGGVTVDIAIRANPNYNGSGGVPDLLQNMAKTVVGQSVNGLQLYSSLAILVAGLVIVSVLIYSGIQTSMTALGRNPLAKQSIIRNMLQVIITGVLIFIGCLIAVYLILKL